MDRPVDYHKIHDQVQDHRECKYENVDHAHIRIRGYKTRGLLGHERQRSVRFSILTVQPGEKVKLLTAKKS